MDQNRRDMLTAAAVTAAVTTAQTALAQPEGTPPGGGRYEFYEKNGVRLRYTKVGSGFPLLALPGRGLNSLMSGWAGHGINPPENFKNDFTVVTLDVRNGIGGGSTGPVPVDDPWNAFADDHLGLMDHVGAKRFVVFGNCMSAQWVLKLLERAPERIAAAVISQPVGYQPEWPDQMYNHVAVTWGPEFRKTHPELSQADVEKMATKMFRSPADFTYVVSREFMKNCQTPIYVLPDQTQAHSYKTAIEIASLAPNAQVNVYPWVTPPELKARTVERVRAFLKAHAK